jgi:uncharacterized protein (TIGR02646 family)
MDLQQRLGDYCSYCERQIETNLAVEHVNPKSRTPALVNDWQNFLLACTNCNSSKGNTAVALPDYFWPDLDNTLRAFEYVRGGLVQPHSILPANFTAKAQATIRLLGLDKDPGNPGHQPTQADKRWLRRQEVWQQAELCKQRLRRNDTADMRELIVEIAQARGVFSIWWTVFAGDVDMRRRLRLAFAGTHYGSFDLNENVVVRAGGQV